MPVLGVTPTNAPPRGKTPRSGVAPRSRQPPATSDSSPAPAAASRPSFSPRGSTADARSAAEAAVRGAQFAPCFPLSPYCACCARRQRQSSAPVASIVRAMYCNVFTFLPRPSGPLHRKKP